MSDQAREELRIGILHKDGRLTFSKDIQEIICAWHQRWSGSPSQTQIAVVIQDMIRDHTSYQISDKILALYRPPHECPKPEESWSCPVHPNAIVGCLDCAIQPKSPNDLPVRACGHNGPCKQWFVICGPEFDRLTKPRVVSREEIKKFAVRFLITEREHGCPTPRNCECTTSDEDQRETFIEALLALLNRPERPEPIWCEHHKWKGETKGKWSFLMPNYDLEIPGGWDTCPVKDCHAQRPE